jgi:1-hydroxycarotenoid 3,4-desaturase
MLNKKEKIIVVGAGIGGLVSALTLSGLGLDVTVVDKNNDVGGKLRSIVSDEGPIDAGPTVLTLIDIFVNIFSEANSNLFDEVDLYQEHTLARHWWPDGTSLDLYSDHEKNLKNITSLF